MTEIGDKKMIKYRSFGRVIEPGFAWHDIRKDSRDLPDEDAPIIVTVERPDGTRYTIDDVFYDEEHDFWFATEFTCRQWVMNCKEWEVPEEYDYDEDFAKEKVIAWCRLPPPYMDY